MIRPGTAVAVGALLVLLPASTAAGATFKPTRLDDPPAGKCKPDDCSLREAVKAANADAAPDEIRLGRHQYELSIGSGDGPPFEADGLDVFTSTKIVGKGAGATTIDANGIDRPIEIGSGIETHAKVTVKKLTLTGGDADNGGNGDSQGGGIVDYFSKSLTLANVVITGNEAQFGGGVESFANKLTIQKSTIAGNQSAEGGGVDLRYGQGTAPKDVVRSSTISGNVTGKGGGILIDGFVNNGSQQPPTLDVLNSTIAGNHASADGGGVMADNNAAATFDNSTFAYNAANDDNTGPGAGGGLYQHGAATLDLEDSLVTLNTVGTGGTGPQCGGTVTGNDANATTGVGVECPGGTFGGLAIGPLDDNGGPTQTIKILSGNGAIGRADDCPPKDQRGKPRPKHHCDSGAYERKGS